MIYYETFHDTVILYDCMYTCSYLPGPGLCIPGTGTLFFYTRVETRVAIIIIKIFSKKRVLDFPASRLQLTILQLTT